MLDVIGHPEWAEDERFADNPRRVENKALIEGMIEDVLKTENQGYWFDALNAAGVPCSPLNTVADALNHEQTAALGILQTDPERPEITSIGFPVSFDGARPERRNGAPELGSTDIASLLGD